MASMYNSTERLPGIWRLTFSWMERTLTLSMEKPTKRLRLKREESEDNGSFHSQDKP